MVWGQWPTIAAKNVEIQLMIIDLGRPFPSHVQGGKLVTVWLRFPRSVPLSANCGLVHKLWGWAARALLLDEPMLPLNSWYGPVGFALNMPELLMDLVMLAG